MGDDGQLRRMADGQAHALILIEIANFAEVRRAVGIDRAASLAPLLAARVAAVLPTAKVAAIGRDTVELSIAVDAEDFVSIVADLQRDLDAAIDIDGATHALLVSIGSALTAEGNRIGLVEAAEASLVRARTAREPGSDAIFATPASEHDIALGEELRIAVERDELFLQYQPKLHLRRQEVTSIEALIRWRHPQRGLVMPNDFIPTAERSDAIEAMSLWTLRRVIADQRTLAQHGHDLPIFINMSGVLLSDQEFVAVVCELVEASGARLGFEVTETSVIREPELAIAHLQRFADIGVAITIDDYGAGLSSLAYLKQLPARELKIDKMFVTQLSSSHRDPLIVRSTIDLAHALEMEVVAEGVETPTSLALLAVMGCDMVQGFLISRPLALDDLLVFLREERHRGVMEQSRAPLQQLAKVRAGQ